MLCCLCVAGRSLVPILKDPERAWVKDFAVTQIARCCSNGCGKEEVDKVREGGQEG